MLLRLVATEAQTGQTAKRERRFTVVEKRGGFSWSRLQPPHSSHRACSWRAGHRLTCGPTILTSLD